MFKSTFDIELLVKEHFTALSNTNVISEEKREGGKKLVKFATTPIMSTYLIAFIVGELEVRLASSLKSNNNMSSTSKQHMARIFHFVSIQHWERVDRANSH